MLLVFVLFMLAWVIWVTIGDDDGDDDGVPLHPSIPQIRIHHTTEVTTK